MTDYYSNGSLGDILRNLNLDFKAHNLECKKNGNPDAIIAKGIELWQARFFF